MAVDLKLSQVIADAPWVRCLTTEERFWVEAEISIRSLTKGSYCCRRGDPANHWYGLANGLMKLSTTRSSGKVVTYSCIPPGTWFGEESLLRDEVRRYDIVALRDSVVACLPRQTFLRLLDNNPLFTRVVLTLLSERFSQFLGTSRHQRAKERLARCLASLFNSALFPDTEGRLKFSQEELGSLVGLSRQHVNSALKELQNAGLLRVEYGTITILNMEELERAQG